MPEVKSYSDAKRIVRQLLGPTGRIWRRKNIIAMGVEHGGTKYLTGEAHNYRDALIHTAMCVAQQLARKANPEAAMLMDSTNPVEGTAEEGVG